MPDAFPAATRSYIMSSIRSRWTLQERTVHAYLKSKKVQHRMHPEIPGKPDLLVAERLAVYLHGCFWHGCPVCYVPPKSRQEYWYPKVAGTRRRDLKNARAARRAGYTTFRIWEHDMKRSPTDCVDRIVSKTAGTRGDTASSARRQRRRARPARARK
jgi:DNA mismatch endonuclease (patch repair protein)